jgi:hypothetical protein
METNLPILFQIFHYATYAVLAGGFLFLLVVAVLVHDVQFIIMYPLLFIIELFVVTFFPATSFFIFKISQKVDSKFVAGMFWAVAVKFAIFHVLFHLSGFYRQLFLGKTHL